MKIRQIHAIFAVLSVLTSLSALAELKVAWLSPSQAVFHTDEAQEWRTQTEAEIKPEQDRLQGMIDQVRALQEKAAKDAEVMTDTDKQKIAVEIQELETDIKYGTEKLQKSVQAKEFELQRGIQPKLRAVVDDLIKLEGYDAIFDLDIIPTNSGGKSATIYVNPKHDITRRVTELLNEKSEE